MSKEEKSERQGKRRRLEEVISKEKKGKRGGKRRRLEEVMSKEEKSERKEKRRRLETERSKRREEKQNPEDGNQYRHPSSNITICLEFFLLLPKAPGNRRGVVFNLFNRLKIQQAIAPTA